MSNDIKQSAELTRNNLSSIDLADIDILKKKLGIDIPEEDRVARAKEANIFYNNVFEDEIKLFIQAQLEFIAKKASNTEQLMIGRGTINGLSLIKEWFERQNKIATPDKKSEEEQPRIPTGLE
jgi:hypothetical protein